MRGATDCAFAKVVAIALAAIRPQTQIRLCHESASIVFIVILVDWGWGSSNIWVPFSEMSEILDRSTAKANAHAPSIRSKRGIVGSQERRPPSARVLGRQTQLSFLVDSKSCRK